MEADESCNQTRETEENASNPEHQPEQMTSKSSDVKSKVNSPTIKLMLEIEVPRPDTQDNVSPMITKLQHYLEVVTSEMDKKGTNHMDVPKDKLPMVLDYIANLNEPKVYVIRKLQSSDSTEKHLQTKMDKFPPGKDTTHLDRTQMSKEHGKRDALDAQAKSMDDPGINILLLGESGSGKSLFINSFAKYKDHELLSAALSAPPTRCIIPMTIVVADQNYHGKQIHFGTGDSSESPGRLETTSYTPYEFHFDNLLVRLIDSPGIGRPDQPVDKKAFLESILNFVSRCKFEINAVAMVANSNQSKFNRKFEEFVRMLLGCVDNVVFLLSHSGDTDYRPGEVVQSLQELLRDSANISLSKENMFCFDNKGFRYMLMKQSGHGEDIEFAESYHDAWKRSAGECCRLIQHLTHNTNSTRGISAPLKQRLMATTEAERYLGNCLAFLDKHLYIISKNQTELPYVKDELTLFTSHDQLKQKEIYRCLSCSKLKQSPTKSNGNKSVGMCSSGIKYSWLIFKSLCLECGCQYKDHEKIDIREAIEQCKQRIAKIESTNNELKTIQMITASFGAISKAMMVPSTDFQTDVGQGTSAGVVHNTEDGDHMEDTVTLANVLQLKQNLLDLKIYGPQLKEHFRS